MEHHGKAGEPAPAGVDLEIQRLALSSMLGNLTGAGAEALFRAERVCAQLIGLGVPRDDALRVQARLGYRLAEGLIEHMLRTGEGLHDVAEALTGERS